MSDSQERKWNTLRKDLNAQEEEGTEDSVPSSSSMTPYWVEEIEEEIGPEEVELAEQVEDVQEGEENETTSPGNAAQVPERVLVVQTAAATTRLIRETLENFTQAEVVTTSDPLRGFELALQKEYRLFLFGMQVGELSGPMLYELISKTYSSGWAPARLAPAVIFIRDAEDPRLPEELTRDVRVKDVINKPVRIDRLLQTVGESIEVLDPTSRT